VVEYNILSEQRLEIYKDLQTKIWQRVITYQTEGFAPRTVWIDEALLPDAVYEGKYPGKPVPPDLQAKGDAVRRAAFDADIAKIKLAPGPRKI
jgi:hypothetical protein